MDKRRRSIFAIIIAVAIPLGLVLLVPNILNKLHLSRASNADIRFPHKLYPIGTKDSVDKEGNKFVDTLYHVVPNYKFLTQSGDSLELDSLRGNVYVLNFFFATCPGICPKLSKSMERVQTAFIKDHNLKLLSVTVDPEKDTMTALRQYADNHDAIPGKWYFLRGASADVSNLAGKGLYVTARPDEDSGPEAFVHSEKLVVVDPEGNIRGYYSGIDSASVNRMMGDLVLILKSYEKGFRMKVKFKH